MAEIDLQKQIDDLRAELAIFKRHEHFFDGERLNYKSLSKSPIAIGSSHKTSIQSIPDTTDTNVVWETNDYANGVTWDSTNNRFTILTTGKYLVSSSILFSSTTADKMYQILLYKNTTEITRGAIQSSVASLFVTPSVSHILDLVIGDYVEIHSYHNSGVASNISGTKSYCYFNVIQVK